MGIAACDLSQHVIRPTLLYLQRHSATAEALLLGAAACQSALGSALDTPQGHGLYRISEQRHQRLWDRHLAFDPDLASRVRGLASQHAFLEAPHLELTVNLRYATAIAWLLIEAEQLQALLRFRGVLCGVDLQATGEWGKGQGQAVEEDAVVVHQQQAQVVGQGGAEGSHDVLTRLFLLFCRVSLANAAP